MAKVVIDVAKTESGYCAACDILPGWVVAVTGDFAELEKEVQKGVQESIDFYVDCARADGEAYPEVFDGVYTLEYTVAPEAQGKSKK